MNRFLAPLLSLFLLSHAAAVNIQGTLGNPAAIPRLMGTADQVYILFASYTQASVIGRAEVKNGSFFLDVPDGQTLKLRPYQACDGVHPSAAAQVYQTETILLYNNALNRAVGPVIQADRLVDPTRVVHWLYSDRPTAVHGRCSGVSTTYDLDLRRGWNAVLTVTQGTGVMYTNLKQALPYWVSGDLSFNHARSALPKSFFQAEIHIQR